LPWRATYHENRESRPHTPVHSVRDDGHCPVGYVAAWLSRLAPFAPHGSIKISAIQGKLAVLSPEKKLRFLVCQSQGRRVHAPLNEIGGAFAGEELIVFDRDCDIPLHSLNFMRFHGAPELLNQSTAPMPEFAGIRFRHMDQ
jgi:hypothetical protein